LEQNFTPSRYEACNMPISSQSLVQPIKIEPNIYFKVVGSLFREWESPSL